MPLRKIPNNKRWTINYVSEFFGNLIRAFNIDLFSKKGFIKTGAKLFPHTLQADITGLEPATAFCKANIDDGDLNERERKLWAVAGNHIIKTAEDGLNFDEDDADGFQVDELTNENSDLLSVCDETEEDIETIPVSIDGYTTGSFIITGKENTIKFAQSFQASGPFTNITAEFKKVGSPADNLVMKIQKDSNGIPSGTDLLEASNASMAGSALTTSFVETEVPVSDFTPTEYQFELDTIYWVVFERSGAADDENYFAVNVVIGGEDDLYEDGTLKSYNGSSWTEFTTDEYPPTSGEYLLPTDNNSIPGETPWTNPHMVQNKAGDSFYASALPGNGVRYYHVWHTFNFDIPTTAIIKGVELNIRGQSSASGAVAQRFWLTKDAESADSDFKDAYFNTSPNTSTIGGDDDLWGINFTPAEVNASAFGVRVMSGVGCDGNEYRCMYLELKVYYYKEETDDEEFVDTKMSVGVNYDQAFERLYVTTNKDVKFLDQDNGTWQSLWRGILQLDELNSEYPAVLKNLEAGGTLILGNENKVHTMIATADSTSEVDENKLIFEPYYFVNWIGVTSSAVFIGLQHKEGELLPSKVVYYEPYTERARIHQIEEGATVGFILDDNCHIIDKSGQIRYFTGASFQTYQYMPPYYRKETITTLPHRNAIIVKQGMVKFLWKGQYPDPGGIWVLEDNNLYHKHSLVFDKTTLNSLGAIEPEETGALFEEDEIFVGASVLDGSDSKIKGVYSTEQEENVTVADTQRAQITTSKISSDQINSVWQDIGLKYEPTSGGEFIVKQRSEASKITEGSGATAFSGTWTASTTFTSTDSDFITAIDADNIEVGDEIIVRKGQGAGLLAHITDIDGTTTKTITIDEGLDDISSGTFTFSVENWEKLNFNSKDTKFSHTTSLKDDKLEWKQFKVDIRDHALEEIHLQSIINKTLQKK